MDWYQIKHLLAVSSGLHMDALHVHIGVLAQLLVAAVMRRSIASPWPWLALLAALCANEWFDLAYETWPDRDEQWAESIKDGWNTMLLPTLLLLLARFAPRLLAPSPSAPEPMTDAPSLEPQVSEG
jgi:ABC-type dipeptide/oligopeptide/nickel transport system permease component